MQIRVGGLDSGKGAGEGTRGRLDRRMFCVSKMGAANVLERGNKKK